MIKKIDHVGIVVKNVEQTVGMLSKTFGFELSETVVAPNGEFKSVIVKNGDTRLELIEPLTAEGGIAKFLERKGDGSIQHVSFRVDDIENEIGTLKAKGMRLLGDKPAVIGPASVIFVHPGSTGGVLVELIQRAGGTESDDK
jgi:methylmalonyl-CoA/ethylmalonyl-CoA epimerase